MSKHPTLIAVPALCLALVGCLNESSNNPGPSSSATLHGTAAVGAPVVGATVTARCADGAGFTQSVTTQSNGAWSGALSSSASLPCALRVENDDPAVVLHSYATALGVANITPLTDLIVTLAANRMPGEWFAGDGWQSEASTMDAAQQAILDTLGASGYGLPEGSPFSTAFEIGDAWDRVLDRLATAINEDSAIEDYAALLNLIKDGNLGSLPTAPESNGDHEAPSNVGVLTAYAGTYTVTGTATEPLSRGFATRDHDRGTIIIGANGNVDFDTGISFTAGEIGAIYDRTFIDGDARRVHVNYDADDSGRKIQVYLDAELNVIEITYYDGQGGLTRAAIGGVE